MHNCRRSVKSASLFLCVLLSLCGVISAWAAELNIALFVDPGNEQRENRQMAERMGNDLQNVLERRGGYEARQLATLDEFKKDQGEYLLNVRIVRYNSGSKAARIIVGFGAGAASMDIHYEFTDPRGGKLLSKDDGVGTSLEWQRLARKLNENILDAIQRRLASGEPTEVEASAPAKGEPARSEIQSAPARVTPTSAASSEPAEQLRKLEEVKKEGLITDQEYQRKRQEILDRL